MKKIFLLIFAVLFILSACEPVYELVNPDFSDGSILQGSLPIPPDTRVHLEGVYQVVQNNSHFGDQVVLKWKRDQLCLYGSKKGVYCILEGGLIDSTLFFEGTWRYPLTLETGLIRLSIDAKNGFAQVISGGITAGDFTISGALGQGSDLVSDPTELEFLRPFSAEARNNDFFILAHRGGGRNSDYIGVSENSIEMISIVEKFGANGIEIDVKLSKDKVPFLYHDTNINLRLTQDSPVWGNIEDFTFPQIKSFIKLKNGESIPSLIEALIFVVQKTDLKLVWLDMKSEKNAIPSVIAVQQEILELARDMGRQLEILIGLPDTFTRNNFLDYPNYETIPSLCELNLDDVRNTNAWVWAPRWTLGMQKANIAAMHNEGRRVFTWTLDENGFIEEYIKEGSFDGILTNYPTIVAYYHYAR